MKDVDTFVYEIRVPSLSEFMELRADAGWELPSGSTMADCLRNTVFGVCAKTREGQMIGMGRVVGDGAMQLFITDVIVHSDWQNLGIGSQMVKRLVERVHEHAAPGAVVGLFAASGSDSFYQRFGFVSRPNDNSGPGMILPTNGHSVNGT